MTALYTQKNLPGDLVNYWGVYQATLIAHAGSLTGSKNPFKIDKVHVLFRKVFGIVWPEKEKSYAKNISPREIVYELVCVSFRI